MIFDPVERRELLLKPYGIASNLAADFEEVHADRSLTGYTSSFVNEAIQCLLVGLDESAYQLLEKAHAWLRVAVDENEIPRGYIQYGTEALRLHDLAITTWLLDGIDDVIGHAHRAWLWLAPQSGAGW